jgi:hypothetical protein
MKKIYLSLMAIAFGVTLMAQNTGDIALAKSAMTIERKAVFQQNMALNDSTSQIFWPIFEKYEAEKALTFEKSLTNVIEISKHLENLTDDKAKDIINNILANQKKDLSLLTKYYKKINKALGGKTAFRFVLIEEQINAIRQVQVLEIPLVD